jgi:predicted outer membrane protein
VAVPLTRAVLCAIAVSTVACATTQRMFSSSGDVDLTNYPAASLSADETNILRGMSDANILGHIIEVDSIEIASSDTLVHISKNDDIINYAKMLRVQHASDWNTVKNLAANANITPTIDVAKLRQSHAVAGVDSIRIVSDILVEPNYLRAQETLHAHTLAELQYLQGVARNPAVRRHVAELMPVVRAHLNQAHAIAVAHQWVKK